MYKPPWPSVLMEESCFQRVLTCLWNHVTPAENCSPWVQASESAGFLAWVIFLLFFPLQHFWTGKWFCLCFLKILLVWFTCSGPRYLDGELFSVFLPSFLCPLAENGTLGLKRTIFQVISNSIQSYMVVETEKSHTLPYHCLWASTNFPRPNLNTPSSVTSPISFTDGNQIFSSSAFPAHAPNLSHALGSLTITPLAQSLSHVCPYP